MQSFLKRSAVILSVGAILLSGQTQAVSLNDMDLGKLWYLNAMLVPTAWNTDVQGNPAVTVAVIDTGVDIDHPELTNATWTNPGEIPGNGIDDDHDGFIDDVHGWNFLENSPDVRPQYEGANVRAVAHGTVLAGVIAATGNNVMGGAGIAYGSKVMPLVALDNQGNGYVHTVVQAIDYAVDHHADIINLSLVGTTYSPSLAEAIRRAWSAGVLVVTAAGNDAASTAGDLNKRPRYPACNDVGKTDKTVLAVASVDTQDELSMFSDYGSDCVDLVAPGEDIYGTVPYAPEYKGLGKYWDTGFAGTSISVAMVSGVAALLKSQDRELTAREMMSLLLSGADSVDAKNLAYRGNLGAGRVNAFRSLELLKSYRQRGANYLANVLARVVWFPSQKGITVEFTGPDGSSPVSVPIRDVAGGAGWQVSVGYIGQAGADTHPVLALFPPAGKGSAVRLYDWSGNFIREYSYGGKVSGLTGALFMTGGSNEWELATIPRQGAGVVKVFSERGKKTEFTIDRSQARWGLSVWSAIAGYPAEFVISTPSGSSRTTVRFVGVDGVTKKSTVLPVSFDAARVSTGRRVLQSGTAGAQYTGVSIPVAYVTIVLNGKVSVRSFTLGGALIDERMYSVPASAKANFATVVTKRNPTNPTATAYILVSGSKSDIVLNVDMVRGIVGSWTWPEIRRPSASSFAQ